jgi:hypothetical protein
MVDPIVFTGESEEAAHFYAQSGRTKIAIFAQAHIATFRNGSRYAMCRKCTRVHVMNSSRHVLV